MRPPFCKYELIGPGVGSVATARTLAAAMGAAARWLEVHSDEPHVVLIDRKGLCGSFDVFTVDREGQRIGIRRKPTAGAILRMQEAAARSGLR